MHEVGFFITFLKTSWTRRFDHTNFPWNHPINKYIISCPNFVIDVTYWGYIFTEGYVWNYFHLNTISHLLKCIHPKNQTREIFYNMVLSSQVAAIVNIAPHKKKLTNTTPCFFHASLKYILPQDIMYLMMLKQYLLD